MRVTRTFAFLDLSGFTAYHAQQGDERATQVLGDLRSAVRNATERRGVRLAKWLGDGAMLSGLDPQTVIACSLEAQCTLEHQYKCDLPLRAGICQGKVIMFEGDDYVGVAVNQASKLCDGANPGQTLVAGIDREDLPFWAGAVHQRFLDPEQLGPKVEVFEASIIQEKLMSYDPVCGLPLADSVVPEELWENDHAFCSVQCRAHWRAAHHGGAL